MVARGGEKKASAPEKPPAATSDQKSIEGGCTTQTCRSRIYCHGPKLKRIADCVVSEEGEHVRREIQHHQMSGILFSHQATGEQRKAGLHKQHQVSGKERPGEVGADARVTNSVGQPDGQRLSANLSLVFVISLLFAGVLPSALISGFGNHKRITGGIDGLLLVARGGARPLALRLPSNNRQEPG